jgi:hypothetical protein
VVIESTRKTNLTNPDPHPFLDFLEVGLASIVLFSRRRAGDFQVNNVKDVHILSMFKTNFGYERLNKKNPLNL